MGARGTFAAATASVALLLVAVAHGQAPAERPQLAEEVFKNVQILRGIPVKEFMGTMGMFSASLGLNCTDCHVEEAGGSWARYADETELKRTTRRMVAMVNSLNKSMFGGRQAVTILTKATWWCGGIFLALSLVLSLVPRGGSSTELQERLRAATPDAPASAPLPLGGTPTDTAAAKAPAPGPRAPDSGARAPQR